MAEDDEPPGAQPKEQGQEYVFTDVDEAELETHQEDIIQAVDRVVSGEDVRAVLEALLDRFPVHYRDAVIGRFRRRIEELSEEYARRRAEEERRRRNGITIHGVMFDMAAAVLLMAAGTYEKISEAVRNRQEIERNLRGLGSTLLKAGLTPDMKMVEKLQKIMARAIQEQREREAGDQQPRPGDVPPAA